MTRFLGDGSTMDRAAAWRAIASALGHWALRGYGQWVITLKQSGEPIGRGGLYNPEGWPDLEVGYVLAPDHQGHGYATEAAGAALRYAFDAAGARRAISLIHVANARSQRVAIKLGGVRQPDVELFGGTVMVYAYAKAPG